MVPTLGNWLLSRLSVFGVVLLAAGIAAKDRIRIDPHSGHFVDAAGRVRIFHGVNVIEKKFPWHPPLGNFDYMSSLAPKDMHDLRSWGLNLVRLGVMWPGVEPSKGQYNSTYLNVMRQLVDDLYAAGIYTIVDFHQDAFAEMYCGEGVPQWLLPMLEPIMHDCRGIIPDIADLIGQCKSFKEYNYSRDPTTGFPRTSDCLSVTFDQYSRTPEVVSSWGNFFAYDDVQQTFRDFWKVVAQTFAGHPGVLGYDLVNEPLNGNFFRDATMLNPGSADYQKLQPMYQALHRVIKSVDPSAISMYEPTPFPDTYPSNIPLLGGVHSIGFTTGPAGDDSAHQALSYHIYSCGFADTRCNRHGDTHDLPCPECDRWAADAVSTRSNDAKKLGGGIVLSEFGACRESPQCIAEINRVLSSAEKAMHSWAYWQFKYFHDITTLAGPNEGFYTSDGKLQTSKVAALSRTYAPTVAGLPTHSQFEQTTGAFRLVYEVEPNTRLMQTEIYLNEDLNYKEGGYDIHSINAASRIIGKNNIGILANISTGSVDIAIARPYRKPMSGSIAQNRDKFDWHMAVSKDQPGFQLRTDAQSTSWKMLKVVGDDGQTVCQLETQGSTHSADCSLSEVNHHNLLFSYRLEFWKAEMVFHRHVETIPFSSFGPLLGKMLTFRWKEDSFETAGVVV